MRKSLWVTFALVALLVGFSSAASAGNYWSGWESGRAQGPMPDCGVNVLPLGGDDILQATVDLYCGLKPGAYESYVNPAAMKSYKIRSKRYPDGRTAVLVFKKIGAFFVTDHKNGKPVYDVLTIADEKSIASNEPGHPLNPQTCAKCHASFDGACRGGVCGNRF